jgi:periplasmic divalent cation tolerance protein
MDTGFVIVLITVPNLAAAEKVSQSLLDSHLAACVNIVPQVVSLYWWQGAVQQDGELLLVVKTRASLFQDRLVPAVQAVHPYEVPEIIALPILMGSPGYLNWLDESLEA